MAFFTLWGAIMFITQVAFIAALVCRYLLKKEAIAKTLIKIGIAGIVLTLLCFAFCIFALGGI